ncbi:tetratricopeptide repeat protein [Chitinispirillales bacterium ANBcel5]|uniref:tetratricopeptide repeat protein n=1 Tax=Cellulosispirillum alkaliphilum TaxID=3039283 RepID=UPI002A550981|nr:tetratricopeptide repeat protein [Chitinispirillales bacterium ANBcel5]
MVKKNVTKRAVSLLIWLVCPLIVLSLTGCAATKKPQFPVILPNAQMDSDSVVALRRAQDYFIRARSEERQGRELMARRFYEMAFELDPTSETLRDILLRSYLQTSDLEPALELLTTNRELHELTEAELRQLASVYFGLKKLDKAAQALEIIEQKSEEVVYTLSLIYESMGEVEKSLELLSEFYFNNTASFQVGLRLIRYKMQLEQFEIADSVAGLLFQHHQENAVLLALRGQIKSRMGQFDSAIEYYESALELDPELEEALQGSAQAYVQNEDYEVAIKAYERLIESSPSGYLYSTPLAILYFYEQEFDQAKSLLLKLLDYSPNNPDLKHYLGKIYLAKGMRDTAYSLQHEVLKVDSTHAGAIEQLSLHYLRRRKYEKATEMVEKYVKHYPSRIMARRLQGYIFIHQEEFAKAAEVIQIALEKDSTDFYLWFELGSALERSKRYDEASDAFRTALTIKPANPLASNYLGYMWAEQGINLDSARILIEDALKADPRNGAYLDSYAWVFYQLGDYQKALFYQNKALKRLNNDAILFSHLGDMLYELGNYNDALEAYKKSLDLGSDESDRIRNRIIELRYFQE